MPSESKWNHAICDNCWKAKNGDRIPVRINGDYKEQEYCCYCGEVNESGIYVRQDPTTVKCLGLHKGVTD